MPASARLTALDASFLEIESPTAHMHVGWVARFRPPDTGPRPSFEQLRDHIAARLCRAPRYRQRLASVPLGLAPPQWVDDESFSIDNHVLPCGALELAEAADMAFSAPLDRSRPLWELWIADRLADGHIGVVGKAHHCLVDGIAAVELASLLLDPEPDAPDPGGDDWRPSRPPGALERLATGVRDLTAEQIGLLRLPARVLTRPERLRTLVQQTRQAALALADTVDPAPEAPLLNEPISPLRRFTLLSRPLDQLRAIKRRFETSVNDVVLAVCAGAMREYLLERGEQPLALKTMVPVNVRGNGMAGDLGNRISFVFVELPCQEPDPVLRLMRVHGQMGTRKRRGQGHGGDAVLRALEYAPRPVQQAVSHLAAGPRAYNLVISNIPGPTGTLYMRGCRLVAAHPVIPLSDRHALSIGLTTIGGGAHFGLYTDPKLLPDAEGIAAGIDRSVDELLALA